ncbi:hypothetical protein [Mycobacterium sp. NPDC050041]|uniref:hypothetical protein n=1 Tax=Mycobacterium sp. NPDC050041 TaxID=3364293 RepID=UPI003C2DB6A7
MQNLNRVNSSLVTRTANTLQVPLPAEFADQLDAAKRLVETAEAIPGPNLTATVLTALAEGRDYHADKHIQGMLLDAILVRQFNIGAVAREHADISIGEALVEYADTILTEWGDALEPHAQALAAAAAALPASLDDTQNIINRGAEAMHHWAAAQEAIRLWRAGTEGFMALAMTANLSSATKRNPLVVTAADVTALGEAEATAMREGRPVDVWILARHQIPLRLATLGDYMERKAAHEQQRQAAAARYEQERMGQRRGRPVSV